MNKEEENKKFLKEEFRKWIQEPRDLTFGDPANVIPFSTPKGFMWLNIDEWRQQQSFFDQGQKQKQSEIIMKEAADKLRYYTPTIEEFHVGFEYESFKKVLEYDNVWRFKVNKYQFTKDHIGKSFHRINLIEDLKEGKIRVKHLDQEDIESLGFILSKVGDFYSNQAKFFTAKIEDGFNTGTNYSITLYPNIPKLTLVIQSYGSYSTNSNLLQITCRNKSELKTFLKQIGYENNTEGNKA